MILTNQQKYIVEVLKQLKYLRVRQLHAMMQAHFGPLGIEIEEHRLNVMLRQLRMASNFVFLKKDLITWNLLRIPLFSTLRTGFWSPVFSVLEGTAKCLDCCSASHGWTFPAALPQRPA